MAILKRDNFLLVAYIVFSLLLLSRSNSVDSSVFPLPPCEVMEAQDVVALDIIELDEMSNFQKFLVCERQKENSLSYLIYALGSIQKTNLGNCTYEERQLMPSKNEKVKTYYSKLKLNECLDYTSDSYISVNNVFFENDKEKQFIAISKLLEMARGNEGDFNKMLSSIPWYKRWFCSTCTQMKDAVSGIKDKGNIKYVDFFEYGQQGISYIMIIDIRNQLWSLGLNVEENKLVLVDITLPTR